MMTIRVLLVEDHQYFRDGLALLFDRKPGFDVVGRAGSIAEGRACLGRSNGIDVAIVDLLLPDGNGDDLIRDLREAEPDVKVLVLTAVQDREVHARVLEAGADEVLIKETGFREIHEATRRLGEDEALKHAL